VGETCKPVSTVSNANPLSIPTFIIVHNVQVTQVDSADCEAVAAACSQAHSLTLQGAHVSSPALFPQLASSCTQLRSLTLSGLTWTSPDVAASLAALGTGLPALQELVATNMSADLCAHTSLCARLTAVQVVGVSAAAGRHMSALLPVTDPGLTRTLTCSQDICTQQLGC
jgi:hypothetical protein